MVKVSEATGQEDLPHSLADFKSMSIRVRMTIGAIIFLRARDKVEFEHSGVIKRSPSRILQFETSFVNQGKLNKQLKKPFNDYDFFFCQLFPLPRTQLRRLLLNFADFFILKLYFKHTHIL